jgi:gluconolactonase
VSLYPPPQDLETEVFARLPESFRDPERASGWIDANKPGAKMDSFLEGPTFDPEGNLYVTDIPHGRIFKVTPDAEWQLATEYDGWPNGLVRHRDGRFLIADYKHGILELFPESGRVEPFLTHISSEGFKGVNDLTFDMVGRLYFTDQGQTGMHDPSGRVFRYDLEARRLDCLLDNGPSPNGLVLNPEETALYVAMTRSNAVWRLPLLPDGSTSKVGIFTALAGGVSGADGMAVDREGNLAVCDAGNGCVWTFSKWGEPRYRLKARTGGRTTTNLAYGGTGNTRVFITESQTGQILTAELDVPGQPLFGLT